MKRFLVRLPVIFLGMVTMAAPAANASHVNVGVSLAVPFDHGAVGVSLGNGPIYGGYGPYYRAHHRHSHHGYRYAPPLYGSCGPWLPYSAVSVAIPVHVVAPAPAPVIATPAQTPAPEPAIEPEFTEPVAPAPAVFLPKSTDMSGCLQLRLRGTTYFYLDGMFFRKASTGYVSTAAPVGAIAQHLPGDAEAMMLGDLEYFASGPAMFRQVRNGFMLVDG